MTDRTPGPRLLGTLGAVDGRGVVRLAEHVDAAPAEVFAALTDPDHLVRWYGRVEGDLAPGGRFRLLLESEGWEGEGRVEACEAPRHLLVTTRESEESWRQGHGAAPFDETIEVTVSDEDGGVLVGVEVAGLPLDVIAFYGVGWQIHLEHLVGYLAGLERGDVEARWDELLAPYQALAARIE